MKIIIFTGAPASGKSTVAEAVSARTGIKVVSKDECKIRLFEKYGFTSHDEKKALSIRGEEDMLSLVAETLVENHDIIIDNNFKDYDGLRRIIAESGKECRVLCFVFEASGDILAERYNARIRSGNRHTALYCLNQYPVIEGITKFHPTITADDVKRIQNCIREETFGDAVYRINTDNIEHDFGSICDRIATLIFQEF